MRLRPGLLLTALVLATALASACHTPRQPQPIVDHLAPKDWQQAMQMLGDERDFITAELGRPGGGDLKQIAAAARRGAELCARGYGGMEKKEIADFATMARACEAWLLQVALEASQGRAELARQQWHEGTRLHCKKCHDAAEKRPW